MGAQQSSSAGENEVDVRPDDAVGAHNNEAHSVRAHAIDCCSVASSYQSLSDLDDFLKPGESALTRWSRPNLTTASHVMNDPIYEGDEMPPVEEERDIAPAGSDVVQPSSGAPDDAAEPERPAAPAGQDEPATPAAEAPDASESQLPDAVLEPAAATTGAVAAPEPATLSSSAENSIAPPVTHSVSQEITAANPAPGAEPQTSQSEPVAASAPSTRPGPADAEQLKPAESTGGGAAAAAAIVETPVDTAKVDAMAASRLADAAASKPVAAALAAPAAALVAAEVAAIVPAAVTSSPAAPAEPEITEVDEVGEEPAADKLVACTAAVCASLPPPLAAAAVADGEVAAAPSATDAPAPPITDAPAAAAVADSACASDAAVGQDGTSPAAVASKEGSIAPPTHGSGEPQVAADAPAAAVDDVSVRPAAGEGEATLDVAAAEPDAPSVTDAAVPVAPMAAEPKAAEEDKAAAAPGGAANGPSKDATSALAAAADSTKEEAAPHVFNAPNAEAPAARGAGDDRLRSHCVPLDGDMYFSEEEDCASPQQHKVPAIASRAATVDTVVYPPGGDCLSDATSSSPAATAAAKAGNSLLVDATDASSDVADAKARATAADAVAEAGKKAHGTDGAEPSKPNGSSTGSKAAPAGFDGQPVKKGATAAMSAANGSGKVAVGNSNGKGSATMKSGNAKKASLFSCFSCFGGQ